ncbi:MAG: helix-turn-helix transcriptional regulator [Clostridium sp.]|uniref:helix-turn-helix transcriptional regulator n=1 Tax=Clostridium sp. TaxID=1506 RepID=UPI003D6D6DB7
MSELLEYLENHYFEDVSNFKLAAQFSYHPVYFNRILHEEVGMSLHQYIINLRITEVIHLLQHSSLPICQIAEKVGYSNAQYFSRIFKYKTGYNPSYLRK